MEAKILTEENCASIIDEHFKNNEVFLCFIMVSRNCKSCKETKQNIKKLIEKYPTTKLHFYYINYATDSLFTEYYQLSEMIDYPQVLVFYGAKDKVEFFEGSLSFEHFEDIHKKYGV